MEYAEKILRKYGWKKGQGLGLNETGISKPIKCNLKFDKSGIGYSKKINEEETNRWWEQLYDKTASVILSSNVDKKNAKMDEVKTTILTDDELFVACGGRTAHRAARHGLMLNGKLERIKRQETQTEPNISSSMLTNNLSKLNCKRRKRKKRSSVLQKNLEQNQISDIKTTGGSKKKKKDKIKEKLKSSKNSNDCYGWSETIAFKKNKKKKSRKRS